MVLWGFLGFLRKGLVFMVLSGGSLTSEKAFAVCRALRFSFTWYSSRDFDVEVFGLDVDQISGYRPD